jgi:hypothetical protein
MAKGKASGSAKVVLNTKKKGKAKKSFGKHEQKPKLYKGQGR